MQLHYRNITKVGLALSLLIFLVAAVVSIRQTKTTNAAASWVAHTEEVLFRSEKMLSIITETETISKANLFTGLSCFLETFKALKKALPWSIYILKELSLVRLPQKSRIDSISFYVSAQHSSGDGFVNTDYFNLTAIRFIHLTFGFCHA